MDNIDDTDSSDNASPLKQKLLKRNSLFGDELLNFDAVDLEDDDWQDVFDDQDEASAGDDSSAAAGSPNTISSSNSDSDHPLTDTTAPSSLTGGALSTASNKDSHAPNGVHGSSRESLDASNVAPEVSTVDTSEQAKNGGLPLTSRDWQNPMEDKPHREKMIQDIVQLLLARKREKNLDEKWVARLKAQARAFESQLYKNATSLESYKDCTTLKRRIAKLADAFASYFKQAKQRKSLLRNPSAEQTSMSVLGSLDVHLSDDDLPGTSMESLPSSLTGRKVSNLRRQISLPVASNSVSLLPGPLMNNIARAQSDTMGATGHNFGRISSGSNMSSSMVGGNFSSMMSSNLGGMMGPMGMQQQQQNNQQLEQQLLASIQQQRAMARQMGIGGGQAQTGNHSLMTGQATMMGNNGMSMLSQMQQQSTNPMMMNLMQQQQSLLQQQQNSMGLNMMQNPNATMMMGNNGINVMNMNMPNVIPAVGNMQGMNFGSSSMMGSQESMMMPPPGMLNTQGMTNRLSGANDDTSPLSPGTFHW